MMNVVQIKFTSKYCNLIVMKVYWISIMAVVWLCSINSGNCFERANPYNRSRWEPPIPDPKDLLNETYHLGMEEVLKLWWRQRRHIREIHFCRQNISTYLDGVIIEPFENQLNNTENFIDDEILVIQDIIWGKRKEVRAPLDKTMINRLSDQLKILQNYLEDEKLPLVIRKCDSEAVKQNIKEIRAIVKLALDDMVPYFEEVVKIMADVDAGTYGQVKPLKWIQLH